MFGQGPHLRGAAPMIEDAGFADAMGTAAKATLVKAALDTAVPMAAEGLTKMCPRRASAVIDSTNALQIVDTPSPGSPFQQFVNGKQQPTNVDDDQIANSATPADNPVLRIDKEVKLLMDKERSRYTDVLDTTSARLLTW